MLQVDDPEAWNRWFPASAGYPQKAGSRTYVTREPTMFLAAENRALDENTSWLWTRIEGDHTFLIIQATNMSEPIARDVLESLKWVPKSEWEPYSTLGA